MSKYINPDNKKILSRYKMHCKNKGLTERSIEAMVDIDLRVFAEWLGDQKIIEIDHNIISDFLIYCSEDRGNSTKTLNRKFTSINTLYNTLVKQETIIKNPMNKLEKPKVRKTLRGHLTMDEYRQLLEYADSRNDLRGAAIISFFFASACRLSEIWQQDRDSLNYELRQFKVRGKGEKERVCMFTEDAAKRLQRYLDTRNDDNPALFVSKYINRLSRKAIQDFFRVTGERAGIKKRVHPHLLRHTRAMALLKAGVPLETIQKVLGHESVATTQIYAHSNFDDVQKTVDAIDESKLAV